MTDERTHAELIETRFDLIDRFERNVDMQASLLGEIDDKAGRIARLVALVLGVVVSALSIGVRFSTGSPEATVPTLVTFGLGTVGLVVSMAGALVTYLSSKIKLGVHPTSARTLEGSPISKRTYSRLVMKSYANTLEKNRRVLDVNARRLQFTLTSLVVGTSNLALAALLYVAVETVRGQWITTGLGSLAILGIAGFVLSGRYLVLEER